MPSQKFIHLHSHSHYSLLTALPKINHIIQAVKEAKMDAVALTDNGNMYGAIEFYKKCKEAGIKPIIGVDFYVALEKMSDKRAGIDNRRYRLVLLAKDETGYKNLIKLVTESHLKGFYYKPRIDREILARHSQGLIAINPSFNGETTFHLKTHDFKKARETIEWHKKIFGDDYYLQISHHPEIGGHQELQSEIKKIARETETPIIASQEFFYIKPEDKAARKTLLSIQTHADFGDNARLTDENEDFSFINQETAEKYFQETPEALTNTLKVASKCNLELELGKWVFPKLDLEGAKSPDQILKELVYDGIKKRNLEKTNKLIERIEYELGIIKTKGYSPYFLVVGDLMRFAHENKILTNIRGSVSGSLITYLAGITNINPLEYEIPFERFLNPDRPSAPDIDMDFADNRRDEMIQYAIEKYGKENVAQIGTFGTMMARGAVRDTARALGYDYATGDRIAKLIPFGSQGFPMTIAKAMESEKDLADLYKKDDEAKEIIDMAKKIEGCARHVGVHAAGVVISPEPLTEYVPLQFDPKGKGIITQYDMHAVEDAGLLKFDFLGIKNLSILRNAVIRVKKIRNINLDIDKIPLNDKKTYQMLWRGETMGLFQLNGQGMTRFLKDLRPTSIDDINAMVALYRPGPLQFIPLYIKRKHNPKLVTYFDPLLEPILKRTYGILVYQDDLLMIAHKLAGYSWLEVDKFRKAVGKKIPALMAEQKDKFINGVIKICKWQRSKAEELWNWIEPFAAYGFNKCLSGDTKIIEADTGKLFTIKEIFEKQKKINVLSIDKNLKLQKKKSSTVFENGLKNIYKLKTRTGKEIKATNNHRFYTIDGWKKLSELELGNRLAIPRVMPVFGKKNPESYKVAALGYLIAEGNFCHPHGIYFYSSQKDEVEDFIKYVKLFSNSKIKINDSKPATSVYIGQINQKGGNKLRQLIEKMGLKNKKAIEKFVPEFVFELTKEKLALFLGKLWQRDGSVTFKDLRTYNVFYATSSKRLAHDVQHLLLRFGILSTIHDQKFKYRETIKDGWTIRISHRENIKKLYETIGRHLVGTKQKNLKNLSKELEKVELYAARGTKDIIPVNILDQIKLEMAFQGIGPMRLSEKSGVSVKLLSYNKHKIGYQRQTIDAIGQSLDSLEIIKYSQSDIYWDEVTKIEKVGREMTFDLTIPDNHNYVANDIITHNSHAVSYGKVAYQTAYMKANFPVEYMAAVMTADAGDVDKIAEAINEAKRINIPVLPPDINESFGRFTVVNKEGKAAEASRDAEAIRFGLYSIKNFGEGIANTIIGERKRGGKYQSIEDFLSRIKDKNLNKKSLESLIKCGALDKLGERGRLLVNMEKLLLYNKESNNTPEGQDSLFMVVESKVSLPKLAFEDAPEADKDQKLGWERELLGLYLSGHPLDKYRQKLEKNEFTIKRTKDNFKEGMTTVVSGIVDDVKEILTKKGGRMAFIRLSDFDNSIEAVAFPETFQKYREFFENNKCIALKGRVSNRNGEISIVIEAAKEL